MRRLICLMIIMGLLALSSTAFAEIKSGDQCSFKQNSIVAIIYQGGMIKFVKVVLPQKVMVVVPINKETSDQLYLGVKTDWKDGFIVLIEEVKEASEKPINHYFYAPLSALNCY